jgi:hypothetical protein
VAKPWGRGGLSRSSWSETAHEYRAQSLAEGRHFGSRTSHSRHGDCGKCVLGAAGRSSARAKARLSIRRRDRGVRGTVAAIRRIGEENAPGAEKVVGPAEANLGVVNHQIPRQRIWAASPLHESGTHEAWVLVVSVTRGRSRSDASCIVGIGESQDEPTAHDLAGRKPLQR